MSHDDDPSRVVQIRDEVAGLKAHATSNISALEESIDARHFRLDEHGRHLNDLESRLDG